MDNNECCLCSTHTVETPLHLFAECAWTSALRKELESWLSIQIQVEEVNRVMERIRSKHWKQATKETVATIWSAFIYHTWRARNWAIFKKRSVNIELVVVIRRRLYID